MFDKHRFFNVLISVLLIASLTLSNVSVVFADDGTPTEAPTEVVPTEEPVVPPVTETPATETADTPIVDSTETPMPENAAPVGEEQVPVEEEAAPSTLLAEIPENTDIVVLDEAGNPIPLASQEAVFAIVEDDPMWCPEGTLPGAATCRNFTGPTGISQLINDMRSNTDFYDENGIIYFTSNPGNGGLSLTTTSLGSDDYDTLNNFNLTLQGGWNGVNGAGATFTGQTNFGGNLITIGEASNPWVGNITLSNFSFNGVNASNALTVYTTSGNITLDNVDVTQQSGNTYTAFLDSNSGNITVQNGSSFDGNGSGMNQNQGFSADTSTGSITITGTSGSPITFNDAEGNAVNYNGATLSAPTVILNYVSANNNDLNGIQILNANTVTLNNATATNNGTDLPLQPDAGDVGSGILVNGTGATFVNITGGTFTNNERYGVEVTNGSISIITSPTCSGNDLGCLIDSAAPVLNLPANLSVEATGPSGAVVTFSASATDSIDGAVAVTCSPASGTMFPISITTVNCSATDSNNHTATGSFTVTVQESAPPVLTLPSDFTTEATGPAGAVATYVASATDLVDGPVTINCAPPSGSTFAITTTTVNCSASDSRGNTATGSFNVTVQDTTVPNLTLPANITTEATGSSGAAVTFSASATDIVDVLVAVNCAPASGSTFAIATTTVNCSATDAHGNTSTGSFNVTVQDTAVPVLTLPADITTEATGPSGAVVTYVASATDLVDGPVAINCAPASGDTFAFGTTTVNCSATDTDSNTATGSFNIIVQDTTPPALTLPADLTAEATGPAGAVATYVASATDLVDGPVTINCAPPSGSTFAITTTTVNCSASDSRGNTATGSFSVTVQDTIVPSLTLPANITTEATGSSGAAVTFSATATDIVDGSVSVNCSPTSGSTFAVTTTTVNCSATDTNGNSATGSFSITVQDTSPPALTLPSNMTAEATGPSGAAVTFSATATDIVDVLVPVICSPASGNTFAFGTTTVNCSATDTNGNSTTGSFNITVQDTTPPRITQPANISAATRRQNGTNVTYSSPATFDLVDGAGTAVCTPVSGSVFPLGNTIVTCTAIDAHGNASIPVTFLVTLAFDSRIPNSQNTSTGGLVIPVTSGKLIELDCFTSVNFLGVRVTFHNLCDNDAVLTSIDNTTLPAPLPNGVTLVQGLDIRVLANNLIVKELADGTGVQLDFPIPSNTQDQYAVLFWDNELQQWLDVSQLLKDTELPKALSNDAEDELYQLMPTDLTKAFYRTLTTKKTGVFVIVKK